MPPPHPSPRNFWCRYRLLMACAVMFCALLPTYSDARIKGTDRAKAGGVNQAEMRVNGHTLLVRIRERPGNKLTAQGDGKGFWQFWGFEEGYHNGQSLVAGMLANEGILLDYSVRLVYADLEGKDIEREIDIPCLSTEKVPVGLSVAYLDEKGTIVSILDTLPDVRLPLYCAPQLVMRALVMPYGWFEANQVNVGDMVSDFEYISINRRNQIIAQWPAPSARQLELAEAEKSYVPALKNNMDRMLESRIVGTWIGGMEGEEEKEAHLVVIVPSEQGNLQASIARYQSLKPWESVLYYINEHNYYDAGSGTYTVEHPGSGTISVATLDRHGTIIRMFDANEHDEIVLHEKNLERYALVTHPGWLELYGQPGSRILPFNPLSRAQLPQALVKAQSQQAQTERLLALLKLKKEQEAEFIAWSRDLGRLRDHYEINVSYQYSNPRIDGTYDDPSPGFLSGIVSFVAGLLGYSGGNDSSNLSARAWQCSDRTYTVSIRPKHDIAYVDARRNAYPVAIDATWQLSQIISGSTATAGTASRQFKLPIHRTNQISERFTFNCVDDLHTERGQETASELHMTLAGQSGSRVHQATFKHPVNRAAVDAENSRQWNLLSEAIAAHNAAVAASSSSYSSYDSYDSSSSDSSALFEKCKGIADRMSKATEWVSAGGYGGAHAPKYTSSEIEEELRRAGCRH